MQHRTTVETGVVRDGYPALSEIVAESSEHDSFIFPRFSRLSARNLLHLASELYALEQKLTASDDVVRWSTDATVAQSLRRWETHAEAKDDPACSEVTREQLEKRMALFAELAEKVKQYRASSA